MESSKPSVLVPFIFKAVNTPSWRAVKPLISSSSFSLNQIASISSWLLNKLLSRPICHPVAFSGSRFGFPSKRVPEVRVQRNRISRQRSDFFGQWRNLVSILYLKKGACKNSLF